MKDAYYFSHDSNARHDPKILSLRTVYGSEGYGWYWIIVEMLREQEDYKLRIDKYIWNALAMQMQCDSNAAKQFASDCINEFGLFESDDEFFWSNSLLKRMNTKDEKSEKARKAAEARWNKSSNSNVSEDGKQSQSKRNADAMQPHMQEQSDRNAIKERKVKESKKNIYSEFVSMTEEEHKKLVEEYGIQNTNKMIDTLNNYKGANGKKYKSDYLAIRNWVVERVGADRKPSDRLPFEPEPFEEVRNPEWDA